MYQGLLDLTVHVSRAVGNDGEEISHFWEKK